MGVFGPSGDWAGDRRMPGDGGRLFSFGGGRGDGRNKLGDGGSGGGVGSRSAAGRCVVLGGVVLGGSFSDIRGTTGRQ